MCAATIYDQVPNVKIVLLGESTVGKTSIINVVHGGEYIPDQPTTIGACFYIKKMKVGNSTVKLHIWDTAGQERFRSLAPMYYRDAQYALLVFAVNHEDSFSAVEGWHKGLVSSCTIMPKVIIVANKIDLVKERVITTEEGEALAKQLNARYVEISAKEDKPSVDKIFEKIAEETAEGFNDDTPKSTTTDISQANEKPKSGCC